MARPRLIAVALAAFALCPATAQAELTADSMYSPERVAVIDLTLPPASVEALEADPDGEYVEGSFRIAESAGTPDTVGAFSAPLSVGIRLKGGAGSFEPLSGKAAFKIKFNEFVKGQKFLGLKKMTLNNMVQDPSMTHEVLAYDLFRALGITAPRTGFAQVYVNGENYGLHLNLESLDDVFLEKHYGELTDTQHLYEGWWKVDVEAEDLDGFEVDEGDEENRADLEALIAAVAAEGPAALSARVAAVADLDQMTLMWAAERYIAHWDGYAASPPNNYYLFSDPLGVFEMLPWGTDQTWTHWWMPFVGKGGLLFEQCLADEACLAMFRSALATARSASLDLDPATRAGALAALLAPWQALEDETRRRYDADEIAEGVAEVLEFLDLRPGLAKKWLDKGLDVDEEEPPKEQPPAATADNPPKAPTLRPASPISPRLDVDRSSLAQGVLLTTISVPDPAKVVQIGSLSGVKPLRRVCAAERVLPEAGTVRLRCVLSGAARVRLAKRRLTLWLTTSVAPDGGEPSSLVRAVVLPRQSV